MSKKNTAQYAGQLLDKLRELDQFTAGAYYEMGRILSAIKHSKLWQSLGYESFSHLVEEELTYSLTTAQKYVFTYRKLRSLNYTETEALNLLTEFGIARLSDWLASANMKVGKRAIARAINKIKEEHHQVNFTINSEAYDDLRAVLAKFGATQTDSGYWNGSSEAFVSLVRSAKESNGRRLTLVK